MVSRLTRCMESGRGRPQSHFLSTHPPSWWAPLACSSSVISGHLWCGNVCWTCIPTPVVIAGHRFEDQNLYLAWQRSGKPRYQPVLPPCLSFTNPSTNSSSERGKKKWQNWDLCLQMTTIKSEEQQSLFFCFVLFLEIH